MEVEEHSRGGVGGVGRGAQHWRSRSRRGTGVAEGLQVQGVCSGACGVHIRVCVVYYGSVCE